MASPGLQFFSTIVEADKYIALITKRVKFNKDAKFAIQSVKPKHIKTQKYKQRYNILIEGVSKKSMANLRKLISGIKGLTMIANHFTVTYAMDTAADKKYFTEQSKGREYNAFIYKYK